MSNQHTSIYRYLVGVGNTAATVNGTYPSTTGQFAVMSPTGGAAPSTEGADFIVLVKRANGDVRTDVINKAKVRFANAVCNTASVSPVIDVRGICGICSADQGIKINFRYANTWLYDGNDLPQSFIYTNQCCADSADCVALVRGLRDQINADQKNLFTASARNPNDNTELNDAALDTWDAEADGCPNLRLVANAQAVADFCGIPYLYEFPTGVSFDVTTYGFGCCSPVTSVVEVTAPVYAEGLGIDIKYLEWANAANSQNGTPYVITESGVVFGRDLNAAAGTSYAQITIAVNEDATHTFTTYPEAKTYVFALPINQNTASVAFIRRLDDLLGTTFETSLDGCFTFA